MITLIQAKDFTNNRDLLVKSFQLRKRVFADQLQWEVPVIGDREFDEYDNDKASYLLWCSPDRQKLYGMIRMIPTTEPTLLFDVFAQTHGPDLSLRQPGVFEGTRMCVDEDLVAQDFPGMDAGHGFNLLFLGLCEAGIALGIKRMVSNFEPAMSRVYRRAGLDYHMHGKADGYGRRPVCCASFEVSSAVLSKMRARIGIDLPVLKDVPVAKRPAAVESAVPM